VYLQLTRRLGFQLADGGFEVTAENGRVRLLPLWEEQRSSR
jgi:hypothetical protein